MISEGYDYFTFVPRSLQEACFNALKHRPLPMLVHV